MDTRAGAVTETIDAVGSLEGARDLATHTDIKMTKRYNRGPGLKQSLRVIEARVAERAHHSE